MPMVRRSFTDIDIDDPNIVAAEAATAQSCASGNCKAVPATHNLQIRVCIFIFTIYVFFFISTMKSSYRLAMGITLMERWAVMRQPILIGRML